MTDLGAMAEIQLSAKISPKLPVQFREHGPSPGTAASGWKTDMPSGYQLEIAVLPNDLKRRTSSSFSLLGPFPSGGSFEVLPRFGRHHPLSDRGGNCVARRPAWAGRRSHSICGSEEGARTQSRSVNPSAIPQYLRAGAPNTAGLSSHPYRADSASRLVRLPARYLGRALLVDLSQYPENHQERSAASWGVALVS